MAVKWVSCGVCTRHFKEHEVICKKTRKKFWQFAQFLYDAWALPGNQYDENQAGVAQWLESLPSKQTVKGSSPFARSILTQRITLLVDLKSNANTRWNSLFMGA